MIETTATNLPRLMACNGSRLMPASFPSQDGNRNDREEGIAAHYMALMAFTGQFQLEELIERKAPNNVYMGTEMAEHVGSFLAAIEPGEMELDVSFGTDSWRVKCRADHITLRGDILYVDDFKYGWHIVEPEQNWTLIAYAIGYCITRSVQPREIVLRIHQPRPLHRDGKLREWQIDYRYLMECYDAIVSVMLAPSDTLRTGAQCNRCRALATCPAARKAEYNAIDATDIAFEDTVSDGELAFELDTLRNASAILKRRLDILEEMATHRIKLGAVVPMYAVENRFGHRAWKPGVTAGALSAMSGRNMAIETLPTPAEAERRGMPKAAVDALSSSPNIGVKLVRIDPNKRATKILGSKETTK